MAPNVEGEAPHNNFDTILVLDFGSQTSHLILRRLRALGVFAELLPCTTKVNDLTWKPKGIVFSGGPSSVYDDGAPHVDPAVFELDVPILGICYGCQEIAWRIDSKNVARGEAREYGHADVNIAKVNSHVDRLFAGLGDEMPAFMSHFDKLVSLPTGFVVIAATKNSEYAGIAHEEKPIFGVQFHPELEHTPRGTELLRNFAVDICGAQPNWKMGDFVQLEIARIRELVGDRALVLGACSGGVDSTVGASIMRAAIGDRFKAILIDNGCMRLNECEEVKQTLGEHLGINLTVVDAGELFLSRLAGVSDPEKKRKIIGSTFIDLFEKEAIRIEKEAENTPNTGKVEWFLQGTLYPDVIESLSFRGPSATIKTHHNVGGLPERMMNGQGLRLIEPLRLLFKDEVRAIGRQLGIHESLVNRHPFPGPGIAIRILGDVTKERVEIARKADHIFISKIREAGLYDQISQAYAGLDTNRSVGVFGDQRVWGYIIILRAVRTKDFMSAEVFNFDNSFLADVSRTICNQVDGVSRVVYDLTSKPPGTIELE
ncbi:putative gmp synthase protein [Phaeoacremonium minimum UCRPA7]|uniref:GMP synthase [glutamine-hydrolyzing] n=1 Tax=Phaeoacremonium minimum (strain UCR-PA7) TaxID=1286976 RepID=R8BHU6_PHAM7|nr:putative gmp synthase protein [Phaeoacremonium minimum UCRPA7]EON98839.1 putative gmp synthase protein [Phaeoacremonium minimum UCRPA7]